MINIKQLNPIHICRGFGVNNLNIGDVNEINKMEIKLTPNIKFINELDL